MVRIMRVNDGKELGIYEEARYIRKAKNGCYVQCDKKDAEGVAANSEAYSIVGKEPLDGREAVLIVPVDGGTFAMQTKQNAEFVSNVVGVAETETRGRAENATEDSCPTASRDYEAGEFLAVDGAMYKVVLPIFAGARITIGTNVEATSIAAEMAQLKKEEN